jgi:NAD(P)H-flavin reductase
MTQLSVDRPEPICGSETWLPVAVKLLGVEQENFNTYTYHLHIVDDVIRRQMQWTPGQFNMLYIPGVGEAAISMSSDPEDHDVLDHTIRTVGYFTRAMTRLAPGSILGLRGPFGRGWPMAQCEGRDIVLLGGGIGLAPLRPVIYSIMRQRERYGRVILLYGCRTPEDLIFGDELAQWADDHVIDVLVTVDNATGDWDGPVGVVTNLLRRVKVNAENAVVMVCGPRILNRVAAWNFLTLHVPPEQVYVSLERNMNCGFGRCGHCQYGSKFVCTDGPVFCFAELSDIFAKEEI